MLARQDKRCVFSNAGDLDTALADYFVFAASNTCHVMPEGALYPGPTGTSSSASHSTSVKVLCRAGSNRSVRRPGPAAASMLTDSVMPLAWPWLPRLAQPPAETPGIVDSDDQFVRFAVFEVSAQVHLERSIDSIIIAGDVLPVEPDMHDGDCAADGQRDARPRQAAGASKILRCQPIPARYLTGPWVSRKSA